MTKQNVIITLLVMSFVTCCSVCCWAYVAPTVTDDGAYTVSESELHVTWSTTDPDVLVYWYGVSTSSTPDENVLTDYVAGTEPGVTIQNLDLETGETYYVHVLAEFTDGPSPVGVSDGITVDTSAPSTPVITVDETYTCDPTQLHASWSTGDTESGIASSEYQITASPNADTDVIVAWTSAGANTSATATGLTLLGGKTYYYHVRARNNAGLLSSVGNSDGVFVRAVPTYQCIGLYLPRAEGNASTTCTVDYRITGDPTYDCNGLDLWYDGRNNEFRGSIVNLSEGQSYDVLLTAGSQTASFTVSTRDDDFPVKQTVYVTKSVGQMLTIGPTSGGSAQDGYVVYEPTSGSNKTIDADNAQNYCVNIDASYVIVRGFILRNAKQHGIRLGAGVHDVVIEDCEITNWGEERYTGSGFGVDGQAAVFSYQQDLSRITIQRNKMHDPRWDTENWEEKWILDPVNGDHLEYTSWHPYGPHAIYLANSLGNNVIRYNEVYSEVLDENGDLKYFNDCFGANDNFSYKGFPGADSDIYGNLVSNCWDDGIEAEGGGCNVRIWGNFISYTMTKVAVTTVSIGPTYIWRNIGSYSRHSDVPVCWRGDGDTPDPVEATGDEDGWDEPYHSVFLKARDNDNTTYHGGRIYLFNNTMLQPTVNGYPAGNSLAVACGYSTPNLVTRNNLFDLPGSGYFIADYTGTSGDFDNDFYDGTQPANSETNGIPIVGSEPLYYQTPSYSLTDTNGLLTGVFKLSTSSDGYDEGCVINNFADSFVGSDPDMGAHEYGTGDMEFGVEAYP